jgi:hypothetical protein
MIDHWHCARGALVWTGRGASLALADVVSTTIRAVGGEACCVPPEEAHGAVAWVSRSGQHERIVDALLTEKPGPGPRILVAAEECQDAWFPAGWQRAALESLAGALGEQLPDLAAPKPGILVVPAGVRAINTLLDAAANKLGTRPWIATTPGDFGHGALARVAVDRTPVLILGKSPEIEAWARHHARVTVESVPLPSSNLPAALLAYSWALAGVAELASTASRPFAQHLDTLRMAP